MPKIKKKECDTDDVRSKAKFPFKGFIIMLIPLAITIGAVVGLNYVLCAVIESVVLAVIGGAVIIAVTAIISWLFTADIGGSDKYGKNKRKGLVVILKLMIAASAFLIIFAVALLVKQKGFGNLYVTFVSFVLCNTGVVTIIFCAMNLNDIKPYACKHCNLLNIKSYDSGYDYSYKKEHTRTEKGYTIRTEEVHRDFYGWTTGSTKGEIKVPDRTVSDGMYKHTVHNSTYVCPYCKEEGYSSYETSEKI